MAADWSGLAVDWSGLAADWSGTAFSFHVGAPTLPPLREATSVISD